MLRSYKGRFMFSFGVDLDVDITLEKLTAQIGACLGSGIQLHFEAPGDLRVDIATMKQLILS